MVKKPILILCAVVALVSLSCQVLFPKETAQPQSTLEEVTVPAVPAAPTQAEEQSPAATATLSATDPVDPVDPADPPDPAAEPSTATLPPAPNTLMVLEDMHLMFWNARVSYNPTVWQQRGGENPPALAHRQLSSCSLYEQGPTEPPKADRKVTLGPVTYMVAEMESEGKVIHWYMAVKGPQGPFADGIPTLVLSSSPEQMEQCRSSAEEVLVSLR